MKIHHLNCGSMCPCGGWLPKRVLPDRLVCHCLLVETNDGLVLVDTGLGTRDFADPTRLGPARTLLNVVGGIDETALHQVRALGFQATDVQHIVVTHLDLDHAGGISDFPHAHVHVMASELEAARAPALSEQARYRPVHYQEHAHWVAHQVSDGEPWFGFEAVRRLPGLPPEVLLVPLPGHSRGHAGVAVQTSDGWLLHAGDAFFDRAAMGDGSMPWGLGLFQALTAVDRAAESANRQRLRALAEDHGDEVTVFCAHDATTLAALRDASNL